MKSLYPAILFVLFFAFVAHEPLSAQRGRGGRPHKRISQEEREARRHFVKDVVAELKSGAGERLDKKKLHRFERMAHAVVRHMNSEDFLALAAKPIAEKVNAVATLWTKMRDDTMERLVKKQTPHLQKELRALSTSAREKRIAELRVLSALDKSITAAEKQDLIDEAEADRLRGLSSEEQLQASSRLNREVFFAIHGSEIDDKEKARLKELKNRQFWRDKVVRKFQLLQQIDADELKRIGKLNSKSRMLLAKAIRKGEGFEAFVSQGVISQERAHSWMKLEPRDRMRLLRDLLRVHLPGMRRGIRLSWSHMSKLTRRPGKSSPTSANRVNA